MTEVSKQECQSVIESLVDSGVSFDEIQKTVNVLVEYGSIDSYIDKFCFRKPIYADTKEPASLGDPFYPVYSAGFPIEVVTYSKDGTCKVSTEDGKFKMILTDQVSLYHPGESVYPESDSWKLIYGDEVLDPITYCRKYRLCGGIGFSLQRMRRNKREHISKRISELNLKEPNAWDYWLRGSEACLA